jgi:hypothetical protein
MIKSNRALTALAAAAAVGVALLPAVPAAAHQQPKVKVIADGLLNPRHLTLGSDGSVYVAEAGAGGQIAVEVPGEEGSTTLCFGKTGGVTKIRKGDQRRLVNLPSFAEAAEDGTCDPAEIGFPATGPHDVTLDHKGGFTVAIGLGADPAARDLLTDSVPFARAFGTLKQFSQHKVRTLADLAAFEAANDPDGVGPDSNPYGLTRLRHGGYLATDAGGNTLLKVSDKGQVRTVAVFPEEIRTVPELSCGPIPGFPPAGAEIPSQFVPTSVVVGPDGAYYVSQLTGFPFPPGAAKVFRVDPRTGDVSEYATGFSAIVDIAFGPDGSLYVVEIARNGLLEGEVCGDLAGRLVKVRKGVQKEIEVPDLVAPGGVAVAKNGTIYVSNRSIFPGGGQVLEITK